MEGIQINCSPLKSHDRKLAYHTTLTPHGGSPVPSNILSMIPLSACCFDLMALSALSSPRRLVDLVLWFRGGMVSGSVNVLAA